MNSTGDEIEGNGMMILSMFSSLYVWLYDKVFVIDKFIVIIESSPFPSKKDLHGWISGNKQALNSAFWFLDQFLGENM